MNMMNTVETAHYVLKNKREAGVGGESIIITPQIIATGPPFGME